MTASLRLLLALAAVSVVAAAASIVTIEWQTSSQLKETAEQLAGGSAAAGRQAFQRYGCGSCHAVTLVPGAEGQVGPALGGIATRAELAGRLANTPANMRRWIQHPQQVAPGNGMPDLGVTNRDAHDLGAYLYTLQ